MISSVPLANSLQSSGLHHVTMFTQVPTIELMRELTRSNLERLKTQIVAAKAAGGQVDRNVYIAEGLPALITYTLATNGLIPMDSIGDEWPHWPHDKFFTEMFKAFPKSEVSQWNDPFLSTLQRLERVRLVIDFWIPKSDLVYVTSVLEILRETQIESHITADQNAQIIAALIRNIKADLSGRPNKWVLGQLHNHLKAEKLGSVKEMLTKMGAWVQDMRRIWDTAIMAGWISKPDTRPREERDKTSTDRPPRNPKREVTPNTSKSGKGDDASKQPRKRKELGVSCAGCGRRNHSREDCTFVVHADYNHDKSVSWANSAAMKAIKAANLRGADGQLLDKLPHDRRANGDPYTMPKGQQGASPSTTPSSKKTKGKCLECLECNDLYVLHKHDTHTDAHTVPAMLTHDACELPVRILFDTGALQGNYLSTDVGDWLRQRGAEPANDPSNICSAFKECKVINNLFSCDLNLLH